MSSLPLGYSSRPTVMADLSQLTGLANSYSRLFIGRDMLSEERLRTMFSAPGIDPSASARLVLDSGSALVGAGLVFHRDPHVTVRGWGLVDNAHQRLGIGTSLHQWILERADAAVAMAPANARVIICQQTFDKDTAAEMFLRRAGYTKTRHYCRMLVEFDAPPEVPQWPEGIVPDTFDPNRDLLAAALASREAFQDHFGFVASSIETELEQTRHYIDSDPDFEPMLWFFARAVNDGAVVGLCLCAPADAGDRTTAYVQNLGVRPAWRRRGLGRALLLHAFGQIHRRGIGKVALHVDMQSLTGATRLYESVGMWVDGLSHEYELEIRPGADLAVRKGRTADPDT
jgi:mycothiol synthase